MSEDNRIYLNGGSRAALLIHGLTGSPFEMKYLAKSLNKAGFTVDVPVLAGHGTTIEELTRTRWQDWYASIAGAFDKLQKEYGTVAVSGLCMGALLALKLAAERGKDVSAISLLSTTLFYDGWSLPWYKFLLPLSYYPPLKYIYSYKEAPPYGIKNERLREFYLHGMKNGSIAYDTIPPESMLEFYRLAGAVKKDLPMVTTPTILLHSSEDDLASSKNADYVEKRISSGKVRKVLLDDSYHMITIDSQKETVMNETVAFFKSCADGGG
ncbi:MAG: alpha/beta fold hydrolase [Deltaproteobacteria bacterium]|nr:alpha/beta fold hydrolase [Deltaproteobacteria bacterium]